MNYLPQTYKSCNNYRTNDFSERPQLGRKLWCIVWFPALPRQRNTPVGLLTARPNHDWFIGIRSYGVWDPQGPRHWAGWWLSHPSEKYESQWEGWHPILIPILIMEHKNICETTNQLGRTNPRTHHQLTGPGVGQTLSQLQDPLCRDTHQTMEEPDLGTPTCPNSQSPIQASLSSSKKNTQAWDTEQNQRLQDGRLC